MGDSRPPARWQLEHDESRDNGRNQAAAHVGGPTVSAFRAFQSPEELREAVND